MADAAAASAGVAGGAAAAALELPDDVQFQLGQFKHLLTQLRAALGAAAAAAPGGAAELTAAVPEPIERARLCMTLAKAANSLHHVYLRAHGRDPFVPSTAGGVSVGRQELDRIRQYDKKVNRAIAEAELRTSRQMMSLDVAAASRFIDAAIPDLTEQQRGALKRAAQAAEAKRGQTGKKLRGATAQARQQQQQAKKQQDEEEMEEESEEQEAAEEDSSQGLGPAAAGAGEEGPRAPDGGRGRPGRGRDGGQSIQEAAAATGAGGAGRATRQSGRGKGGEAADGGPAGARAAAEQFLATFASK